VENGRKSLIFDQLELRQSKEKKEGQKLQQGSLGLRIMG
jgi:hypothetical protein